MPKHIIIMTPDEEGGEVPCKVDVEYEWLPPRCTSCMTLGHSAKECTVNKPKSIKPPVNVYVPKVGALRGPMVTKRTRDHPTPHTVVKQTEDRGTRPTAAGPSREERVGLCMLRRPNLERIMQQKRAKMEWMKGDDQCSRVFFRKIAQRRTARRIMQINDAQGITITEPNAVIHEFISYYQSLLGGDRRQRVMDLRFLRPWARHIITTEEAGHLLEPFSAEDIKKAVFDIGKDRAPGPDGPCQAAFVPGRSIGDNVMLAQELFTGYNQARLPPRCALNVDIRKAYETVEWNFLLSVPQLFGFPKTFSRWVEECISSPSFSVGMNGKPHGYFAGARGLRQGDPLSPYLFVLVMEGLALSYAGRVQIIKAVLVAMGVYWASAFILPKGVIKNIEKRLRAILWRGTGNSGYPKVAWKEICKPMEEGGLGLKDMGTLNRALMCKKLYEVIRCDRTSIWVEWLRHGRLRDDSIWAIPENRGPWGWKKMLRLRGWLRSVVEYRIGDGSDFFLWKDPWHHLGPLLDRFPRGPNSLGLHESTMLCSVICEGHWHWPLITDMECVEITHVLPRIHGGTDRIIWKGSSGKPTTQDVYRAMIPAGPKVDLVEDASVVFGALYDSSGLIGIGSVMLNGVQENGVGSTSSIYPTDACLDRVYTIFGGRET
ncbi:uncharacterized protein LOC105159300 [Sesamum indicum]|uniref:Uncharacterized protein LOC105159300 n=1 Tax=Sesamum indicum TaxID=4182 RepID=A0A6I9SWE2_SESIN|nr:uncharacterized protein LOC105159300 [Sesamum indicum]